jgi:hypothetical protein
MQQERRLYEFFLHGNPCQQYVLLVTNLKRSVRASATQLLMLHLENIIDAC